MVLHTIAATQEVPQHNRLHLRGSTRSRPHPEEPHFRLLTREKGSFPCVVGKEFPAFPSHLKRRRSPQERREELQGRATIPRVNQMSLSIPGKPVSPALPRLSNRGSTDTTVARGTSLWEILVGKPGAKASWESVVGKPRGKATDPLILSKGSSTLLLQLGGKCTCMPPLETRTDSSGETPEVPQDASQQWRGILRFWHRLHTRS